MTNKRCAEVIQAVKFMLDDTDYTDEVEEALTMAQQMLGDADEEIDCPLHGEHEEGIWDNGYRRGYGRALLDFGLEDWGKPSEMLDKIKAEVEQIELLAVYTRGDIKSMALEIIDKYRAESEVGNSFAQNAGMQTGQKVRGKMTEVVEVKVCVPKDATNGDMIKAMYPNAWKSNYIDSANKCTLYIGDDELEVDIDWWNAPYKAESEG